jgi:hypothetical protein
MSNQPETTFAMPRTPARPRMRLGGVRLSDAQLTALAVLTFLAVTV